jgi:tetratricopeptide (TPR) repeat protein
MRRALLVFLGILACASPARADWRSLTSDHFLVIGDATDRDLRDVALRLEQFREVVGRLLPGAVLRDENSPPVVVLVFRSLASFEPFMPRVNGRAQRVAGFFQPGEGVNYIALTTENGEGGLQTILHEFAHLLLRGLSKDAPLWFHEGLAEYYSTFEVVQGGHRANIGKPIAGHVGLLRERRLPFAKFFAIDRGSPEYTTDTTDRAVLYAQAWAIVHHAFHGDSKRRNQLLTFVQRVADGSDTATAFRDSYGIEVQALEREVQLYVQRSVYSYGYEEFDERIVTRVNPQTARLSDAEADAWLGDLLVHMGRSEEALSRINKALAVDPNLAVAHASLGTLRMSENKTAEARTHLEKAIALGSANEFVHFAYAYAVLSGGAAGSDDVTSAVRALERAIALRPGYSDAKLLLAYAYLTAKRAQDVVTLLAPLLKAEPTNHPAALRLAEAHLQLEELDTARRLLGPVLARSTTPSERDRARELLGVSAGLQRRRETLAAAGVGPTGANTAPASAGSPSPAEPPARLLPQFRKVAPEEQRTYGVLEGIECSPERIVLLVRTTDGLLRAAAPRFMDIEFIAYRKLATMQVSCGKQDPLNEVYLTWRQPAGAGPGSDRTVVAVEILPEGFVP